MFGRLAPRCSLAALVGAVLSACPAAHTTTTTTTAPPPPPPALQGAWQSACYSIKNADETDGSARVTLGLTATQWARDLQIFEDDACARPAGLIHDDGAFAFDAARPRDDGAWPVRFDLYGRTITPFSEGFIAYLQAMSCQGDFGVERRTEVLDVGCAALGLQPFSTCSAEFDIVHRDGDLLTFGNRPAGVTPCQPTQRPRELGPALTLMTFSSTPPAAQEGPQEAGGGLSRPKKHGTDTSTHP
jgi:hypothetical protein